MIRRFNFVSIDPPFIKPAETKKKIERIKIFKNEDILHALYN